MNINKFVDYSKKFHLFNNNGFDDFSDRLNFKFSGIFYSICFMAILVRQFLMKPIACYTATHIGGMNLLQYMEYYCYVAGTVPIDFDENFPDVEKEWEKLNKNKTIYYQWVIYIFALQMSMFYLPQFIWKMIYKNVAGRDLRPIIKMSNKGAVIEGEERQQKLQEVSSGLEKMLYYNREIRSSKFRTNMRNLCPNGFISKRSGNRLFTFYIMVKMMYLMNSIGQIVIMQHIFFTFPTDSSFFSFNFGAKLIASLINGTSWQNSLTFPRASFCFAKIAHLGTINHAVAQCALPLNMLIEKIFIFAWCWCVLLSLATILTTSLWLYRMSAPIQKSYFKRHFNILQALQNINDKQHYQQATSIQIKLSSPHDHSCSNNSLSSKHSSPSSRSNSYSKLENYPDFMLFVKNFLRNDGVFILKMIAMNSGEIFANELVWRLWLIYSEKYKNINFNIINDSTAVNKLEEATSSECSKRNKYHSPSAPSASLLNSKIDF